MGQLATGRSTNRGNLKPEEVDDEPVDDEPTAGGTNYKPKGKTAKGIDMNDPFGEREPVAPSVYKALAGKDEPLTSEQRRELRRSFYDSEKKGELLRGTKFSADLDEALKAFSAILGNMEISAIEAEMRRHREQVETLRTLGKSLNVVAKGLPTLDTRFQTIEKSLANRSGLVSLAGFGYLEKAQAEGVTREEVATRIRKGIEEGKLSPDAMIQFEGQGMLTPQVQKAIGL